MFNEGNFLKKIRKGEYKAESKRCSPVPADSDKIGDSIPIGSISQTLYFFNTDNQKAIEIQRYIKPDGSIGASRKNDPKEILVGNVYYHRERPDNPQPRLTNKEVNQILGKRGFSAITTYGYDLTMRYGKWRKEQREKKAKRDSP